MDFWVRINDLIYACVLSSAGFRRAGSAPPVATKNRGLRGNRGLKYTSRCLPHAMDLDSVQSDEYFCGDEQIAEELQELPSRRGFL